MSRIAHTFERLKAQRRAALIPFVTAGAPERSTTVPAMHALVAGGADIIELGVPFSDPMADGPVIQRASERALANGTSLTGVLDMVREFRRTDADTPVVLMGYLNPIERMGVERFARAAAQAGVDGVLTVDLTPEESADLAAAARAAGLDLIFLLAPTTPEARMDAIARIAGGFVYYVSLRGVTGAAHLDLAAVRERLLRVRRHTTLPLGVGFGISDPTAAQQVSEFADAVIVGSAVVRRLGEGPDTAAGIAAASAFVRSLRRAMDNRHEETKIA